MNSKLFFVVKKVIFTTPTPPFILPLNPHLSWVFCIKSSLPHAWNFALSSHLGTLLIMDPITQTFKTDNTNSFVWMLWCCYRTLLLNKFFDGHRRSVYNYRTIYFFVMQKVMGTGKFLFHCIPTDLMFHTSPLRDVLLSLIFFDNWQNTGWIMHLSTGHCIKEGACCWHHLERL